MFRVRKAVYGRALGGFLSALGVVISVNSAALALDDRFIQELTGEDQYVQVEDADVIDPEEQHCGYCEVQQLQLNYLLCRCYELTLQCRQTRNPEQCNRAISACAESTAFSLQFGLVCGACPNNSSGPDCSLPPLD